MPPYVCGIWLSVCIENSFFRRVGHVSLVLCVNMLNDDPTSLDAAVAVGVHEVDMLGFDFQKPEERIDHGLHSRVSISFLDRLRVCGRGLNKFRVLVGNMKKCCR